MPSPDSGESWLDRLGLNRPELRAWAMYDWANSAFWTTVIAVVFPQYFARVAAADLPAGQATSYFAWASALAVAVVAALGPVLGAIADYAALKKRMLAVFIGIGVASTAALWFVDRGDWQWGLFLFVMGNIGAAGSITFSDSLLPHIAAPHEVDRVSSSAYAIGYLGGGLLLVVNTAWIAKPEWFGMPGGTFPARLSFVSVAVWWLAFSVPIFRRIAEPPARREAGEDGGSLLTAGFSRLGHTFRELRVYRQAFLLLVAFAIYNDGINTIIRMAGIYGAEIGLREDAILASFIMVQVVGVPCSFLFGWIAGRVGAKRSVLGTLAVYAGISVFGYYLSTGWQFFLLAFMVGTVQGGSQALSRSLFASMIPRHKSSEFFAFFGIFEKFGAVLGPALFGLVAATSGSSRPAILAVILFFVVGGYLLARVDVEAGQRTARDAESAVGLGAPD
jgi:UMF1 family MFS transporter